MKEVQSGRSITPAAVVATLGLFLLLSAIAGFLFAVLVNRIDLQNFFFDKGDKFLIPRYSYWFTFSLLQFLALGGAYVISMWRDWLKIQWNSRSIAAGLTIGLATPGLRFITPAMNTVIGVNWDFFLAPLIYVLLLSAALCMFSGTAKLVPVAVIWNLLFVIVGFALVYAGVRLAGRSSELDEFIQWPVLESMIGLSFGSWLVWRQHTTLVAKECAVPLSRSN